VRYPQRCRSLTIIAQGAEYRISPHPLIWLLHELYLRLPVEHVISAKLLRKTVIKYITSCEKDNHTIPFLPRQLIEEQFCKIPQWPFVYKYSVLPVIHNFTIKKQLAVLTMPVLLINRADDALAPESETRWLATNLPNCAGYHVISGRERFFMYSQSETVTPLIEAFLTTRDLHKSPLQRLNF
jgi:pimeloyl-ACP methyl ester carboxylesterase